MTGTTYTNLINRAMGLYREGKYWDGYQLITAHADREPRNEAQMYDFRVCMACRTGRIELAMDLLEEAVFQKGCWFGHEYLTEDQDLRPLRQLPGFGRVLEVCAEREKDARSSTRSAMKVVRSAGTDRGPLIIVLHGNSQNIAVAQEDWSAVSGSGYDLAFIQSSQAGLSDGFVWNDLDRGVEDLRSQYERLRKEGELEGRDLIIAGFSAGARLALHSVLNDTVEVKGALLMGPWLPEIEDWLPQVPSLRGKGIYVICGAEDSDCLPGAQKLAQALEGARVPNRFRTVEGLDHDYPGDFARDVSTAVELLTGRR